jgi:hypothetical protein
MNPHVPTQTTGSAEIDDETITETLLGVLDIHNLICDTSPDWLEILPEHLRLTPDQRRCIALLLIGTKAEEIHERVVTLLADQLATVPDLNQFVDCLLADDPARYLPCAWDLAGFQADEATPSLLNQPPQTELN